MFLAWTVFDLNIVLAVLQFLLVGAVGAILAIYSKFGDEYANSIRWSWHGGNVEMARLLHNSRHHIPIRAKIAMALTIIITLVAFVLDKGVAFFVSPAERFGQSIRTTLISPQYTTPGAEGTFNGWSTSMRYGDDIVGTMASGLNSTRFIRSTPMPGKTIVPVTSPYKIVCNLPSLRVLDVYTKREDLGLIKEGCADVLLYFDKISEQNFTNTTVTQLSNSRWSIAVPQDTMLMTQSLVLNQALEGQTCGLSELAVMPVQLNMVAGMSRLPTTVATKCVLNSGGISVLTMTFMRFTTGNAIGYNNSIPTMFMESDDELLLAMGTSIRNTVDAAPYNPNLLVELRAHGSTMDAVMCLITYRTSTPIPVCLYASMNMLIVEPREPNAELANVLGGNTFKVFPQPSNAMTVEHVPTFTDGIRDPASVTGLQRDTAAVTDYMALLGQNFYADYNQSQLYFVYDSLDTQRGFEVPWWLLILVAVLLLGSLCLWIGAEVTISQRYWGSLYMNISSQLTPRIRSHAPTLMPAKTDPVELAGVIVFARPEKDHSNEHATRKGLLMDIM
ncbi:hypothetical protein EDD11_009772 [Mortierella claussenii]|nr:hypothetical protein EDD11_009772 [Mortierella claussenii]